MVKCGIHVISTLLLCITITSLLLYPPFSLFTRLSYLSPPSPIQLDEADLRDIPTDTLTRKEKRDRADAKMARKVLFFCRYITRVSLSFLFFIMQICISLCLCLDFISKFLVGCVWFEYDWAWSRVTS